MKKILDQSLVVQLREKVGMIMNVRCASYFKGQEMPSYLDTLCIYHIPKILGDYLVFECLNSQCKYYL